MLSVISPIATRVCTVMSGVLSQDKHLFIPLGILQRTDYKIIDATIGKFRLVAAEAFVGTF